MNSCCDIPEPESPGHGHIHGRTRTDTLFWGSLTVIVAGVLAHLLAGFLSIDAPWVHHFGHSLIDLLKTMWWGVALGLVTVGLMGQVPKSYFNALLGRGDRAGGIFRAAAAGLLLDLCSHGILMVGAKFYERGASLAQVMTFLIASPWNSLSLTFILIALIGLKWTLLFILGSAMIAVVTGFIYLFLTKIGVFPSNPNAIETPDDFHLMADAKMRLKKFRPGKKFFKDVVAEGWRDGRVVLRWLMFGIVLASLVRTFVPAETFADWFAPTLAGLALTLVATTLIEVCSEGSAPIGADLVIRAEAPGNGFAFLMAGVSTDYTEIMVLKNMTRSWKMALSLPLLTVPQIVLLGWIMNQAGL